MPALRSEMVLVVEDEDEVRLSLKQALSAAGYRVTLVTDGLEALKWLEANQASLILLDVEMPNLNGWDTLEAVRGRGISVPVLMMTHIDDVPSRVRGLEAGADDYLGKPFAMPELLARAAALLRRPTKTAAPKTLRLGTISIDLERKTCSRDGKPLRLTATEYTLLELLHRADGKPVSREHMLKELWGVETGNSHTVDTHLWRLRRKLGGSDQDEYIKNLPGLGYVLFSGADSAARDSA